MGKVGQNFGQNIKDVQKYRKIQNEISLKVAGIRIKIIIERL